ncbi:MAG: hypothetical protein NC418_11230 [Muribaculaceae bacterium]|nr:hypothetical protein [Muribaculaceae bacterium]
MTLRILIAPAAWLAVAFGCMAAPPAVCRLDSVPASASHIPAGVWQIGGGGAVFAIEPVAATGIYELRIVDSPDYTLPQGHIFGTMTHTGTGGTYDVSLAMKPRAKSHSGIPGRRTDYIFTFDPTLCKLTMRHYRKGWSLNVLRALPYLFRISVSEHNSRPAAIDGAVRIAPPPTPQHIVL